MNDKNLDKLYEIATESHARIQQDFEELNPMIGINQGMRQMGVPADVMTIDCLKSGKRIIIVLHDQQPDIISYQFSFKDKDPDAFEQIPFRELTADTLYGWMKSYLSADARS